MLWVSLCFLKRKAAEFTLQSVGSHFDKQTLSERRHTKAADALQDPWDGAHDITWSGENLGHQLHLVYSVRNYSANNEDFHLRPDV